MYPFVHFISTRSITKHSITRRALSRHLITTVTLQLRKSFVLFSRALRNVTKRVEEVFFLLEMTFSVTASNGDGLMRKLCECWASQCCVESSLRCSLKFYFIRTERAQNSCDIKHFSAELKGISPCMFRQR